ncbi:cyclin-D1-1 isoform X2 [Beta vulgaris subsp. vulgaris]|uniref:cyclin-D1-1 isoform X2 n=1 Tax=Beta vulgaris subsp. vulgaris TaxID=3555 RepID=UPI0020370A86|nr:cyclin-D1-1 isoform X2 [Beta vulgaris subsp. vulgaris]
MSFSYSTCFPDLLYSEESGDVISGGISSSVEKDESIIAGFIEEERNSDEGVLDSSALSSSLQDSSARSRSVAWILKVRAFYGFEAVTAYLAVNYLDRFLSCHHLPLFEMQQTGGWPLQLLSVACLSLAAKMEEPLVPSLLDLQVESAKFVFEPKTIQKMELLVLGVLNWRLRLVTPFTFISFFAYKLDATGSYAGLLIARSTNILLSNLHEGSFLEYWPSSIAAAAILCAAIEMPSLSFVTLEHAESWCDGLCKEEVEKCYKLMKQYVVDHSRRKSIKVIPQLRVTAQIITKTRPYNNDSSQPSSSTSSSSPFSNKRRKLNNYSLAHDDDHDV